MHDQRQRRAALTGRSLAEAEWATTPAALRSANWAPSRQVMGTLRTLRRASPRLAEAVAAHAELRWRELAGTDRVIRGAVTPTLLILR
jgi:hypothetical protein